MKVLITGAAGFLGSRLARELIRRGRLASRAIERLVLTDRAEFAAAPNPLARDGRVQMLTGDLLEQVDALAAQRFDGIFHLASAVSAECEADFGLGMRANLDTTRRLLDACRAEGNVPRIVFSSSLAVFGADPGLPLPEVVRDDTLPTPQTSYGMQKFVCEQLLADHTRRGHLDGRAVRLMTVVVRPGRPNAAASGFLSSLVREPLAGLEAVCPVDPSTPVALSSATSTIDGLITAFETSREAFGGRTALNLPALTVTVQQMLEVLGRIGGDEALSRVRFEIDPTIERMVIGWPARVEAARARRLGLHSEPDFATIVRAYVREHREAVANARALAAVQEA
ncbi:MAG TPA: D-erythronate dehydrogenase [Burkholderiaceae bacterium]